MQPSPDQRRVLGTFQFGLAQGGLYARVGVTEGVARLEFSSSGADENEPMSGRACIG